MMPTIRVIRVDYADEAAFGCLDMEILMSAFNYIWENKEVHDV